MVQLELDEFYLESPSIFKPEIILLGHEFEQGSSDRQKSVPGFEIFLDPGPARSFKLLMVLGPTGFGPWISEFELKHGLMVLKYINFRDSWKA